MENYKLEILDTFVNKTNDIISDFQTYGALGREGGIPTESYSSLISYKEECVNVLRLFVNCQTKQEAVDAVCVLAVVQKKLNTVAIGSYIYFESMLKTLKDTLKQTGYGVKVYNIAKKVYVVS